MKMSAPTQKASAYFKPKSYSLPSANDKQAGINMVDLMMWLVIAALLLAAAIQGIGYYQSASSVYTLKNDLNNAVSVAHAQAALGDGVIDDDDLDATLVNTEISEGTILTWGTVSTTASAEEGGDAAGFSLASLATAVPAAAGSGQAYVLTAEDPAYPDTKVVYFLGKTAGYEEGIKVTDTDEVPITEGGSTETSAPAPTPTPTETTPPVSTASFAPIPFAASICQVDGVALNTVQKLTYAEAGTTAGCNLGPNSASVQGGLGGLVQDVGVCGSSVDITASKSGNHYATTALPYCDSTLIGWKNTINGGGKVTIKVPVYNYSEGSGPTRKYGLTKYANFEVVGWRFDGTTESGTQSFHHTSTYAGSSSCTSMCRGLIGKFTS